MEIDNASRFADPKIIYVSFQGATQIVNSRKIQGKKQFVTSWRPF